MQGACPPEFFGAAQGWRSRQAAGLGPAPDGVGTAPFFVSVTSGALVAGRFGTHAFPSRAKGFWLHLHFGEINAPRSRRRLLRSPQPFPSGPRLPRSLLPSLRGLPCTGGSSSPAGQRSPHAPQLLPPPPPSSSLSPPPPEKGRFGRLRSRRR